MTSILRAAPLMSESLQNPFYLYMLDVQTFLTITESSTSLAPPVPFSLLDCIRSALGVLPFVQLRVLHLKLVSAF